MFNPGMGLDGIASYLEHAGTDAAGGDELGTEAGQTKAHGLEGADTAEGSDEADIDVAEQRRRALEALSGTDISASQSTSGAEPRMDDRRLGAAPNKRQSRMIPTPSKTKTLSGMPPPSALGRTSSVRKTAIGAPAVKDRSSRIAPPSAASAAVGRSHLRNASNVSTSTRPLSRSNTATPSSARPPSSASVTSQTSQAKTARQESGLKRNSSTTDRNHSRTASALPALQLRPQFSTYQQHYSPKKSFAPKPPTSSYLPSAPTAKTVSVATSPLNSPADASIAGSETSRQQIELLQLHLLHASALPCLKQFEASAEAKFRKRFECLSKRCAAVKQKERQTRTAANVAALNDWCAGIGPGGLAENVQILGSVLRELAALSGGPSAGSEHGVGRVDRIVSEFARWLAWVERVWDGRKAEWGKVADGDPSNLDVKDKPFELIEPLGEAWHVEVASVQRKVALLLRELDLMDEPSPGSSVADVVNACRQHLIGTSDELKALRQLSEDAVKKEERWVDYYVSRLDLTTADS
ncbi:hypothetical protein NA57DRAFT_79350 [Rhizodiscina lignyota]|uniref:Uncharacterized protein n=1 Tax=Rhizodiscina lignyota TaxID=1504668 RepID=A0A9P4M7A8_9PEZI|nr:hypothetical protein NA57DRAFT_79350 [Rhizodiscina lignyota]